MFCFRLLKDTINIQKQQYFGTMPLTIQEKFTNKLKQTVFDKKAAFKALCNAKAMENECSILKEQLQKESQYLKNLKEDENARNLLSLQEECKTLNLEVE